MKDPWKGWQRYLHTGHWINDHKKALSGFTTQKRNDQFEFGYGFGGD